MFNKIIYLVGVIFFQIYITLASESLTINTPERFGFNGSLQKVELRNVKEGPSDSHFEVKYDPSIIYPVSKGHMSFNEDTQYYPIINGVYQQPYNEQEQGIIKNSISTYGIARLTFDSYEHCCHRLGIQSLENLKVNLNSDDRVCSLGIRNAYYERELLAGTGRIELCSQVDAVQPLPVARFFDIVAHETGHSILDALNGRFYGQSGLSPFAALHESFGDLSAFFASAYLARLPNNNYYLRGLISDLNREDVSICLARNLGGQGYCMRSSGDLVSSCKAHDNSTGFTNFYVNFIGDMFKSCRNLCEKGLWVIDFCQSLLVQSVITSGNFNTLYEFGDHIISQVETVGSTFFSEREQSRNQPIILQILNDNLEKSKKALQMCADPRSPQLQLFPRAPSRYVA
jgi:hypothetical protein